MPGLFCHHARLHLRSPYSNGRMCYFCLQIVSIRPRLDLQCLNPGAFSARFHPFFRRFRHVSCCYSFLNKNVTCGILHCGIASYTLTNPVTVPNRLKIVAGKFGSKEKSRTFAIPFEKRVSERTGSS